MRKENEFWNKSAVAGCFFVNENHVMLPVGNDPKIPHKIVDFIHFTPDEETEAIKAKKHPKRTYTRHDRNRIIREYQTDVVDEGSVERKYHYGLFTEMDKDSHIVRQSNYIGIDIYRSHYGFGVKALIDFSSVGRMQTWSISFTPESFNVSKAAYAQYVGNRLAIVSFTPEHDVSSTDRQLEPLGQNSLLLDGAPRNMKLYRVPYPELKTYSHTVSVMGSEEDVSYDIQLPVLINPDEVGKLLYFGQDPEPWCYDFGEFDPFSRLGFDFYTVSAGSEW